MSTNASFRAQLNAFTVKLHAKNRNVFTGVVQETHRSIVEGSELTGSPGQPVDTGNLKGSWIVAFPSENEATITTNVVYAPNIEEGVGKHGPLTLRSAVGGFHSLAQTVAGFDRIVDHVVRQADGTVGGPITSETGFTGEDGG